MKLIFDSFSTPSPDSDNDKGENPNPQAEEKRESSNPKFDLDSDADFLKFLTQAENESKKKRIACQDMLSILTGLIWLTTSEMIFFSKIKPEQLSSTTKELMSPENISKIHKISGKVVESMARSDPNLRKLNLGEILKDSIRWSVFREFVKRSAPNIFRGLSTFFYSQFCIGQTLSQRRGESLFLETNMNRLPTLDNPSELLNHNSMTLLLWMLPEKVISYDEWHCLYVGSKHGFSMNRFSNHVFKYPGPTIMLIRAEILPPKRSSYNSKYNKVNNNNNNSGSGSNNNTILLGVYVESQWRSTNSPKNCFGSEECFLFELYPTYETFPTSKKNSNYVYYNPSVGIGFGGMATSGSASSKIVGMEENSFVLQVDNTLQFGKYRVDPYRDLVPTYSLSGVSKYMFFFF